MRSKRKIYCFNTVEFPNYSEVWWRHDCNKVAGSKSAPDIRLLSVKLTHCVYLFKRPLAY